MRKFATVLAAVLVAVGCNKGTDDGAITETREVTAPKAATEAPAASSAERFGLQGMPAAAPAAVQSSYTYKTPEGWQELPASQFVLAKFKAGANKDVDVSLSEAGGGVPGNVNRWRNQLGLEPLSEEEIAQLPKKTVLGQDAVFVNWEGTFGGMQATDKKEGYRLAGVILDKNGQGVFVKMVGPAASVDQELARLDEFTASLQQGAPTAVAAGANPHAGMMGGDPHAGMTPEQIAAMQTDPTMGTLNDQVSWTAPEGWEKAPDRPMRSVTFKTPDGAEAYVSVLSGMAGGAAANINRWRNQMGIKEVITPEEMASLPKIDVLGKPCPVVEITGEFQGMGGTPQPNAMLLGTVAEMPNQTVFVKMTGPEAAVKANKDKFVAFSQSLTMKQPAATEAAAAPATAEATPPPAAPETSQPAAQPQQQ